MSKVLEILDPGALKISECRLRIADFQCAICLIFQSAIRNLKSAINFAPMLRLLVNSSVNVIIAFYFLG
jgi:hypothetical protein